MALIRSVLQHPTKKCWAYVEYSDENSTHSIVLGGKEFDIQDEAWEYSKGFEPFSYEWKEPKQTHLDKLFTERMELEKRLAEINNEINSLG